MTRYALDTPEKNHRETYAREVDAEAAAMRLRAKGAHYVVVYELPEGEEA